MLPLLKFLLRRLAAVPITFLVITAVLYSVVMLAAPEERASLYLPPRLPSNMTPERMQQILNVIIEEHGLNDPFPQQYFRWLSGLLRGDWGWSPVLNADVLEALLDRTPATAELTLYSILLLIPIGLVSGVMAGWQENSRADHRFRLVAFVATSIPPFILGLFLLSIFYVGLGWFAPGRTGITELSLRTFTSFQRYTGLLTVDGLLNGRLDVTIDALRHLALPVFSLSLAHWATLARVTRATVIDVKDQEYIVAARARGLLPRSVIWQHAFRNALLPGLTSSALSAASLVTGVFIIEVIFNYKGVAEMMVDSMLFGAPDAPLTLGFAVYSVLLVLPLMFILDVLKAVVDPRVREGEIV
ncbi:MAG: ABC transporter permease [Chloroflexi bacterium]|nr:ABC transporter permease [Chloroflexota bacterium]MCI0648778.1 ABC transporter permease [Chloroflexota bacterium]MCI0727246.1 ABC transporter permease [Chloroflexota bacterium]